MTVHGDFSRAVAEGFNGVLYQQGRVFLDADATAQTILTTAWQDTAARDAIGAGVAAVPAAERDSFQVEAADIAAGVVRVDLKAGRVWADGLLVQLAEDVTRRATYLKPPVVPAVFDESTIAAGVRDAVVLEVWRDAISAFQMPQTQLEPALGGPDTTERLHTSFALKLYRLADGENCETIRDKLGDNFAAKGKLTVTRQPTTLIAGDCPVVEGGGYTGFEHNFYRIEMAELDPPSSGGTAPAMFKWSQYNGGLVAQVEFNALGDRARLTGNMPAVMHSNLDSFYMEVLKLDADLGYWQVVYGAQASLVGDELVPSATALKGAAPGGESVFVRLWNGIRPISDFAPNPNPTELQDGIRLEFEPDAAGRYTAGDYWTFNVYAGELFNPETIIDDEPPEGVRYHRVPLGVLEWDGSSHVDIDSDTVEDCRNVFDPLTRIQTCCTYHVGDGVNSHGDFTSIQAAVDALPDEGGEVCVLPGVYNENVRISGKHNITISGCGGNARSIVRGQEGSQRPVFHLRDCRHMKILGLMIEPFEDAIGVLLEDRTALAEQLEAPSGLLQDIELGELFIRAGSEPAIQTHFSLDTVIHDCTIEMYDVATTKPAVYFQGEDGLIERNVIRVRPREHIILFGGIEQTRLSEGDVIAANLGFGGLQLAGLCERVRVLENVIQGGIYNGITLGSLRFVPRGEEEGEVIVGTPLPPEDPCPPGDSTVPDPTGGGDDGGGEFISDGPLRDIYIERNRILDMGLNGIGVVGFFAPSARRRMTIISVENLTIQNNEIRRCLRRTLADIRESMLNMIGYAGIALAHVERLLVRENEIRDNGPNQLMPICGIFVLLGEGIEIDENRIINNGMRTGESDEGARPGVRGGIAIVAALPAQETVEIRYEYMSRSVEPTPAVSIHDNIVVQPLGQAIILMALGPVSVQANSLTTQGMLFRRGVQSLQGATVTILNLGTTEEDLGKASFTGIAGSMLGGLAGSFAGSSPTGMTISPSLAAYARALPSGAVLFSDNQVLLDLSLKREETIGRLRGLGEARSISGVSMVATPSTPFAEAAGVGLPWQLELRLTSILILSLDDLGFHDNQCFTRLTSATLLTQALLFAASIRVSDNRFKEGVTDAILSAVSVGLINVTSQNEATHCLLILPVDPVRAVRDPNIIVAQIASRNTCAVWDRLATTFERLLV